MDSLQHLQNDENDQVVEAVEQTDYELLNVRKKDSLKLAGLAD